MYCADFKDNNDDNKGGPRIRQWMR